MIKSLSAWIAVAKFAEEVMSRKEQAGRARNRRGGGGLSYFLSPC